MFSPHNTNPKLGRVRSFLYLLTTLSALWTPVFFAAAPIGCGAVGLSGAETTATETTDTADALSTTDAQLYDDGPVDLPVTIAKLDSPDLTKITVTAEEIGSQSVSSRLQVTATHTFTITGTAGAASTPKVFVFNTTSDEQVVADAAADGSFTTSIDGALTDTIVLANMNDSETQVSPPLVIGVDENGVPVITLTNAADFTESQSVTIDSLGNYYMSVQNTDATYTILRRNQDGSQIETIATALASQPRIVLCPNGTIITLILDDGTIMTITRTPDAGLQLPHFATDDDGASWSESVVDTISGGLIDYGMVNGIGFGQSGYDIVQTSNNESAAIQYPKYPPGNSSGVTEYLLRVFSPEDSNNVDDLLPTTNYEFALVSMGPEEQLYVLYQIVGQSTFDVVRFGLSQPITTEWDNRETLISGIVANDIPWFDVSETTGDIVYNYYVTDDFGGQRLYVNFWDAATQTTTSVTDSNSSTTSELGAGLYFYPTLTPGGEIVVACELGDANIDPPHALVYWKVGDPVNEMQDLVRLSDGDVCSNNDHGFTLTGDNLLYFVKTVDDMPELSVIDLTKVPGLEDLFSD